MDLPIICTLSEDDRRRRGNELLPGLMRRAEAVEVEEDVVRVTFAGTPEAFADIARTIAAERECCRFLRFELEVEPDLGPIRLRLSGPPGTGKLLADLAG